MYYHYVSKDEIMFLFITQVSHCEFLVEICAVLCGILRRCQVLYLSPDGDHTDAVGNGIVCFTARYKSVRKLTEKMVYVDIGRSGTKRIVKYNMKLLCAETTEFDNEDDDDIHVIGMHVGIKWACDMFDVVIFPEQGKVGEIVKVIWCYVLVILHGRYVTTQDKK